MRAEVARGDPMAALGAYRAYTLRPLLEVIRMRHCPERYDYGPKYSRPTCPPRWWPAWSSFFFVPDLEGIPAGRRRRKPGSPRRRPPSSTTGSGL